MVIGIEQLPERRAENTTGINDRQTKRISVNNLVGGFVNTDFAANTADNDEKRENRPTDYIEVLSQTAEGNVHIFMGLREYINRHAIMTVELEPVNSSFRERFIFTGIDD